MKKIMSYLIILSLLIISNSISNPLPSTLISEYSTDPPWIELYSIIRVDLSNCVIRTNGDSAFVNPGVVIEEGAYLVLDQNNTSGFTLNPTGDEIEIYGNDIFVYGPWFGIHGPDASPLPNESAADGNLGHRQFNFQANPNPGEPDFGVAGWTWNDTTISINEVSTHCVWNNNCGFIELYNSTDSSIDISGYQIICNARYTIADGTTLEGHSFFVLDQERYPSNFLPTSPSDNIYLLDDQGVLLDQVGWSSDHGEDISLNLIPDGEVNWIDQYDLYGRWWGYDDETSSRAYEDGFPSRGAFNRYETPGLKIIGIRAEQANNLVNIYWTNPVWLSIFETAILRKSYDGFPMTPFDGEIVYEGPDQQYLGDIVPQNQTAYYTVFARTGCGAYSEPDSESQISVVGEVTGIGNKNQLPERFSNISCYPNPFNAEITFKYTTDSPGAVRLNIYNLSGQKVIRLVDCFQNSGEHSMRWNASDFPSSVYFAKFEFGGMSNSTKLVLLK